jgi:hypothetical protein
VILGLIVGFVERRPGKIIVKSDLQSIKNVDRENIVAVATERSK